MTGEQLLTRLAKTRGAKLYRADDVPGDCVTRAIRDDRFGVSQNVGFVIMTRPEDWGLAGTAEDRAGHARATTNAKRVEDPPGGPKG